MLRKTPVSSVRRTMAKTAKIFFVVEGLAFVGAFGLWSRMNTSRDFRFYMHNNHKWALEAYYQVGEWMSSSTSCRDTDLLMWKTERKE